MLAAGIARQAGDVVALAREAALYEEFGVHEAVPWVAAEAALLWVDAGELDRARGLLHQLAGSDFSGIARDLDWLLTMVELTEVSVATGTAALAETALGLLVPYAGRGVVNGGGAAFAGVISDYLYQASNLLGTGDAQQWAPAPPVSTSGWAPRGGCAASRQRSRSRDSGRWWWAAAASRSRSIPRSHS